MQVFVTTVEAAFDPDKASWEDKEMHVKLFVCKNPDLIIKVTEDVKFLDVYESAKTSQSVFPFCGPGKWMLCESMTKDKIQSYLIFLDNRGDKIRIASATKISDNVYLQNEIFLTTDALSLLNLAKKVNSAQNKEIKNK
jgi:hypothetical protein